MNLDFLLISENIEISRQRLGIIIVLLVPTLSWFLILQMYIYELMKNLSGTQYWINFNLILFYGFGILSAILGSTITKKISRMKLIIIWIFLGVFTTASSVIFHGVAISWVISIMLGFSFGLGFPIAQSYLASYTAINERARVAGIIILLTLILLFLSRTLIAILGLNLTDVVFFLVLLKLSSLFALKYDHTKIENVLQKSWFSVLSDKEFLYYIVPWFMFCVASALRASWSFEQFPDYDYYYFISNILFLICASVFAYLSGIIADYIGRKSPIIISLVLMGISFAVLYFEMNAAILLIFNIFHGIAWGGLLTIYITIPGDLAFNSAKEKYYVVGSAIPLVLYLVFSIIAQILPITLTPQELAPILAIIIISSIIPIMRAIEPLPISKMRYRNMKKYIDKVGELIEEHKEDNL
jgi:MFS family permease